MPTPEFTPAQQKAIEHYGSHCVVAAVAGSGKTTVLTHRVANLIDTHDIKSDRILLITFTKAATKSMKDRLDRVVPGNECRVATFHSFCLRWLREFHPKWKERNCILDPEREKWKADKWAAETVKRLRLGHSVKPMDVKRLVDGAKSQGVHPERLAETANGVLDQQGQAIFRTYHEFARAERKFELSDIQIYFWDLIDQNESVRDFIASCYDEIMVDEFQDTDITQDRILKLIVSPRTNLMVVGDDDQCQPGDTEITLPGGDTIPIENLDPREHTLTSYNIAHSTCVGLTRSGRSFKKASRHFVGDLATLTAGSRSTRVTPNHKCVVRFNEIYRTEDRWVTYLMKRGDNYRIGWCKLRRNDNVFHPRVRMNLEDADALWIVSVHDSAADASMEESILSNRYNISQMPFKQPHGADHYTQERLDAFWEQAFSAGAHDLLDHINATDPICQRGDANTSGKTVHVLPASNVLSGLMEVPVFNNTKTPNWETVTVDWESWEGEVYSLDVDDTETYVADGIITHNSIYSFRHTTPQLIIDFHKNWGGEVINMEENFRSQSQILAAANSLIHVNELRMPKTLRPVVGDQGTVEVLVNQPLVMSILDKIRELRTEGFAWGDIAILYRTNAESGIFESVFTDNDIPYICASQREGFFGIPEVKTLISYLRMFVDNDNTNALRFVWNRPKRFLRNDILKDAMDASIDFDVPSVLDAAISRNGGVADRLRDIQSIVEQGTDMVADGTDTENIIDWLVGRLQYPKWLKELADTTNRPIEDLEQIVDRVLEDAIGRGPLDKYLRHVDKVIENSKKQEKGDAILLTTLHRSKGLEWPVVFFSDLVKDIVPHVRGDITEERRLAYVGVTRAMHKLYICTKPAEPSIFIAEMGLTIPDPTMDEGEAVSSEEAVTQITTEEEQE